MGTAKGHCEPGVAGAVRLVHRLDGKSPKVKMSEVEGVEPHLRHDDLELVAVFDNEPGAGLGTDADPVEPRQRENRAVGLDRNLKAALVQRIDQQRIELKQRLAAGADDKP